MNALVITCSGQPSKRRTQPRHMINSRDPTLPSANQFTCRGSGLQVCAQGHSRFKVRTLSWSRSIHRAFLSPSSRLSQLDTAVYGSPRGSPRTCRDVSRENYDDAPKTIRIIFELITRPGTTGTNVCAAREPPRRCGYTEGWKPASLPAGRDGLRRGGTGWENLTCNHGDRSRRCDVTRRPDPAPPRILSSSVRTSGASRYIGMTPLRVAEPPLPWNIIRPRCPAWNLLSVDGPSKYSLGLGEWPQIGLPVNGTLMMRAYEISLNV